MNSIKIVVIAVVVGALTACTQNDKYDQLIVIDGNGNKYILRHNIGDTYFIGELNQTNSNDYVNKANSNIK